jgi:hypothetical protein
VAAVILRVTDDALRAPLRPDASTPEALITDPSYRALTVDLLLR